MQTMQTMQTQRFGSFRQPVSRSARAARFAVKMAKQDEPKETSSGSDSYAKIEAPVRDTIPDGGKPVEERNWGQEKLNPQLKADETFKPPGSDVSAADAMRFAGAIPEVANSRLAMLAVISGLAAEITTGQNIFQQWEQAKVPIILTFGIFTLATSIPVFKGTPRRGNGFWSADAELLNGRTAMLGFAGMVISTFYFGKALFFL